MRKLLVTAVVLTAMISCALAQNYGVTSTNQSVPGVVNFCFTGARAADGSLTVVPCAASGAAGFPGGATPITGNSTGTTGAVVGTLAGAAGKTTYICGFNVSTIGGTAASSPITVAGLVGSSQVYQTPVNAAAGQILVTQNFNPCIPASAVNTAITVTTTAAVGATAVDVNSWGYQL